MRKYLCPTYNHKYRQTNQWVDRKSLVLRDWIWADSVCEVMSTYQNNISKMFQLVK